MHARECAAGRTNGARKMRAACLLAEPVAPCVRARIVRAAHEALAKSAARKDALARAGTRAPWCMHAR
eukprot:9420456-Alexandrium_andersonii.AAC.1